MKSRVSLHKLAKIEDVDFMKMIFSSGDYFPGFYRFTLGTQKIGDESLSLSTLVWLYFEQVTGGKHQHKEHWLQLQHDIYDRDVASDHARNAENVPLVRDRLNQKMMSWYFETAGYDLIYMDTVRKVEKFEKNRTYFFMGSLIHYSEFEEVLNIGYNDLEKTSAIKVNVPFSEVESYLTETYSSNQMKDLFLYSEVVGRLDFREDKGETSLSMDEMRLDSYMLLPPELKVFASPVESRDLPMRFAKPIRLTNFKRGRDGAFSVWQSNQNW